MSFPTTNDLKLMQAVRDRINETNKTQESLLAISKAFHSGASMLSSVPFYIEGLVKNSDCIALSPLELVLASGSPQDIADFLQAAPKVSLKDITLPNLLQLSFEKTKYISSASIVESSISTSIDALIDAFGNNDFGDIVSSLLLQHRFFEGVNESECKNMWQSLKDFDVEITPHHDEIVNLNIHRYLAYTSPHKSPDFTLKLIDESPAEWFKEIGDFQKKIAKIIDIVSMTFTNPQIQSDILKIKSRFEKRILSEEFEKKVATKTPAKKRKI